jgi:hypothetical protein
MDIKNVWIILLAVLAVVIACFAGIGIQDLAAAHQIIPGGLPSIEPDRPVSRQQR